MRLAASASQWLRQPGFWFLLQQQLIGWTWISQFHLRCLFPLDPEENLWGQAVWFFWAGCLSCHLTNSAREPKKTQHRPQPVAWTQPPLNSQWRGVIATWCRLSGESTSTTGVMCDAKNGESCLNALKMSQLKVEMSECSNMDCTC